jgi:hypothetical protein
MDAKILKACAGLVYNEENERHEMGSRTKYKQSKMKMSIYFLCQGARESERKFGRIITYSFASARANLHPFPNVSAVACFSEVAAFYDGSVLSSH